MEKDINKKWNWQGLLVISILMIVGILIIYFTWGNKELNSENLYQYFCEDGFVFIFALFFIIIGIYCYYTLIINNIITPKIDVLYLKDVNELNYYIYESKYLELIFLNRKGKKYKYITKKEKEKNEYVANNFYDVLRTKDDVKEVIQRSIESFDVLNEKKSYWFNFYAPGFKVEDMLVLPILYVLFLPCLFSFILSKGTDKMYGFILGSIPFGFILYDFIYKKINK